MRRVTEQLLARELGSQAGLKIMDAGCGTGGNLGALTPLGHVIGFDASAVALGYARRAYSGRLAQASIEATPYPDDAFDLVTSFDVIYSCNVADDVQALREMAHVTRPGGYVLIRVSALPALRGPHDVAVHGCRRYTERELRRKLAEAGLAVRRVTYANSLLLPGVLIIRRLQRLLLRAGRQPATDVWAAPKLINRLLIGLLEMEAHWIGGGHRFPLGVSLFALATKPG